MNAFWQRYTHMVLAIISINKKPDTQKILIYARRNIRLIRTPVYNGQFLKFTFLIRTPDNTDTMDTFLCPEAQTLSTLLFTDTGYLPTFYFPCHNHVLFVNILHCPNNDRFLGLSSRIAWYVWFYVSLSFRVLYSHLIITTQVSLPWRFGAVIVPTLLPLCLP